MKNKNHLMSRLSLLEELESAPQSSFHTLDEKKSKRMGGVSTLYIPSVHEVANAIKAIPKGETRTIEDLRAFLAKSSKADTACPAKTLKYWKWMANLPEELKVENSDYNIPWWRVLKSGKPSRHMPGGIENQKALLISENVLCQ